MEVCMCINCSRKTKNPKFCSRSEINSLENLIALCKNHHWEFDNNGPAEKYINSIH